MNNQTNIEKLITSGKTVFTTDDLSVIWQLSDRKRLLERIKYYVRQQRLVRVYKGVYGYGEASPLDIAQKLVPMSYISLYTSAQIHGLIFQYYSTIYSIALRSKKYNIASQTYEYHKVKEQIFYNGLGLYSEEGHTIASKERTICDLLYVFPGFAFDNLKKVDVDLLKKLSPMYGNKRLEREVAEIITLIESNKRKHNAR